MVRPDIVPRVEEALSSPLDARRPTLALALVAQWTGPGEILQVVGAASRGDWGHTGEAARAIAWPESWGNDMVEVERGGAAPQAVVAHVVGAQPHDVPDTIIGIVARLLL
jgi:hypothetical protein